MPTSTFFPVSKFKKRKQLICCSLFHTKVFVIFKGILDPFSIFHRSSIFLKQHTTNIVREVYYHKRQHIDRCRCVVVIVWCNNSTAYLCDTESWIYWNALFVKLLRKRDQKLIQDRLLLFYHTRYILRLKQIFDLTVILRTVM